MYHHQHPLGKKKIKIIIIYKFSFQYSKKCVSKILDKNNMGRFVQLVAISISKFMKNYYMQKYVNCKGI